MGSGTRSVKAYTRLSLNAVLARGIRVYLIEHPRVLFILMDTRVLCFRVPHVYL